MGTKGLFARIYDRLFIQKKEEPIKESFLDHPDQSLQIEAIRSKDTIDLYEQMKMINMVDHYLSQYAFQGSTIDPLWNKGFSLKNEIFISNTEEPVSRSNMEVFFQDPSTGEKKLEYLVSLVRFPEEDWRVFQVKEVVPI
ncbi:MAG TPA: hypothetical protein VJ824_07685 [Bacillota bacterium]|nr:hypothetical protein [Bacillota bacterium]